MATKIKDKTFTKKKPTESSRDFIRKLKKGLAYTLDELNIEWGVSINTIRSHAKELDAHRWMKDEAGDWAEVVLHPETAKELDA